MVKTSEIALRDYQQNALNAVTKEFQEGVNRQLMVMPTAGGKTIVMAAIAKNYNSKALILAHRDELIQQARDKFKRFWPEVDIGICKAEKNEFDHQVVIGSVQSCRYPKRLAQLKEQNFQTLMIDETHHAAADSYQTIINALGFNANSGKLLLGVTATPQRADRKQLGDTFDKIIYEISIGELIQKGYLSQVIGRKILTSFILKKIRTQMGDFEIGQLAEAVNTPERNKFVVEKCKAYAIDRKILAFGVNVQHCKDLAQEFIAQGFKAKAVWGDMPLKQRRKVLNDFKKGNITVIVCCNLLTEGFDEPSITSIVVARPTKSKGLYTQMVGRGFRINDGKENCLVLDFTDQGHNLDNVISLSHAVPEATIIEEEKPKAEPTNIANEPTIEVNAEVDREFNILGLHRRYLWVDIGDNESSLVDDDNNEIIIKPQDNSFVADIFYKSGNIENIISKPRSIEYCFEFCENYAHKYLKVTYADLTQKWLISSHQEKPTPAQIKMLENHNAFKYWMSKTEAMIKIRTILALQRKKQRRYGNSITLAQKYVLEGAGINTDNLSKQEAFAMIANLKEGKFYAINK